MNQIVPPSFLFQYSLSIPLAEHLPFRTGGLLRLPETARIFVPGRLNGPASAVDLRMAWNPEGLGISVAVSGRKMPVAGRRSDLTHSDHVQLMIDTRHTASVHRATGYCASLAVLPLDEDTAGQPQILVREIAQQRDVRQTPDPSACQVRRAQRSDGYLVEAWIPAEQLFGFREAPEIGMIGFYCVVRDTELGELPLSVGDDFPVTFDPSTWLQVELSQEILPDQEMAVDSVRAEKPATRKRSTRRPTAE